MVSFNAKLSNDPYFMLGVDRSTSFTEVKKKYFQLAKKYHPDLNPNNDVRDDSSLSNFIFCQNSNLFIASQETFHNDWRSLSLY